MRKTILCAAALLAAASVGAQPAEAASGADTAAVAGQSEWLPSFTEAVVEGPMEVVFERVPETEAPRITYDTKGSYTTRFKSEVRDRVLYIRERADARRPERTTVRVRCNDLRKLTVSGADVRFEGTVTATLLDMSVGDHARVEADMQVQDLALDQGGFSEVVLRGSVRYLTLQISSGSFDAVGAECLAARITAQSKARVELTVSDRLEARTTTGATIRYGGNPPVMRSAQSFFAGAIAPLEAEK